MFKFIQQYTESMENIAVYPMVSLLIFFIFFVSLILYVIKMDKGTVNELSNIPLDSNEEVNHKIILKN
jgi:cytochrome c oxidase cbb3-type subunit IV